MHPSAVIQATKLANLQIFDPDTNQDGDWWNFQYRIYHDALALDNHTYGIYSHKKA
jgi:hypothetical protein